LAKKLVIGGVDFIKDDELHCSLDEHSILERVSRVRDAIESVTKHLTKECLYAVNVTAEPSRIVDLANAVISAGANCIMVNIFATGFDTVKMLAESSLGVPIHTHRCMHDVFTACSTFGVAPVVFAELARLCGADFYHVGTPNGKSEAELVDMRTVCGSLKIDVPALAKTIPVSSRATPLSIPYALRALGDTELMFIACGGIYRPPGGVEDAVRALRESVEIATNAKTGRSDNYQRVTNYFETLRWPGQAP